MAVVNFIMVLLSLGLVAASISLIAINARLDKLEQQLKDK